MKSCIQMLNMVLALVLFRNIQPEDAALDGLGSVVGESAGEGLGKGFALLRLGWAADSDGGGMEGVACLYVVSLAGFDE